MAQILTSGINTSIFGAYSVRETSTSAAASAGISITDILSWSSELTFHRPTDNPEMLHSPKILKH